MACKLLGNMSARNNREVQFVETTEAARDQDANGSGGRKTCSQQQTTVAKQCSMTQCRSNDTLLHQFYEFSENNIGTFFDWESGVVILQVKPRYLRIPKVYLISNFKRIRGHLETYLTSHYLGQVQMPSFIACLLT